MVKQIIRKKTGDQTSLRPDEGSPLAGDPASVGTGHAPSAWAPQGPRRDVAATAAGGRGVPRPYKIGPPTGMAIAFGVARTQPGTEEAATDWQKLLHGACLTLSKTPESLIPAISVTLSLTGRPDEARAIATLSRRLAAKHGLQETMALEGRHVTVRFSRRADGDQTPGTR